MIKKHSGIKFTNDKDILTPCLHLFMYILVYSYLMLFKSFLFCNKGPADDF